MFVRIFSGAVQGVDAFPIEVEVDCCNGLGQISVVGLPDASVKESQERVRSAIKACSFLMPPGKKWVVNLAPCDIRKEGPAYDLPIATAILAATGMMPFENIADLWFIGELSLSGSVRPVSGVLPIAVAAKKCGAKGIVVPEGNVEEAALVEGLKVYPVSHLMQVYKIAECIENGTTYDGASREQFARAASNVVHVKDFKDVKGQRNTKRGLEIVAAGRHNILLVGSPGSGKSMLAERLPGIMPPLEFEEAIELTKLWSVAGLLTHSNNIIAERPFRSPHHSASIAGLVGGGAHPKPGEISLSHLGVLFLDELTEFSRSHLENLRQPLETRTVTVCRAGQTLTYPAAFTLVGACNPCPCGFRGDQLKHCLCTSSQAERYWGKLSGPFLDRIDLKIEVPRLDINELTLKAEEECSASIRERVLMAVERQRFRNKSKTAPGGFVFNSALTQRDIQLFCDIDKRTRDFLARAVTQFKFSARAYDRILRLSRTIADLFGSEKILHEHVSEAVRYRLPVSIAP